MPYSLRASFSSCAGRWIPWRWPMIRRTPGRTCRPGTPWAACPARRRTGVGRGRGARRARRPVTSMIGTVALRTTIGAITACSPTDTPSTTTAREPMNAPSSMITGRAPAGRGRRRSRHRRRDAHPRRSARTSRRCPRVDHRPRADPRADVHVARHQDDVARQERAVARGCGRDDAHSELFVPVLERDLVAVLERPELDGLHRAQPKYSMIAFLASALTTTRRPASRRRECRRGRARDRVSTFTAPPQIDAARATRDLVRHEGKLRVPLARRTEVRAGCERDAVLQQRVRERLPTTRRPERRTRGRGRDARPVRERRQRGLEQRALSGVQRPVRLDVLLVRPRGDRRALHELLRRVPTFGR